MKVIAIAVASALGAIAPAAIAQVPGEPYYGNRDERPSDRWDSRMYRDRRGDTARVVDSRPIYAQREECWNPRAGRYEVRTERKTSIGKGAAAGALLGGVLGHQVDRGEGTAAGAILGGVLGHQIEKRSDRDELDLSNCRVVTSDSNILGYEVRYRYRGDEYVTQLARDPGERLTLGEEIRHDGTPFDNVATASSTYYR